MRVWPGSPSPLGATWDGEGTNFAVFSERATAVDLCLFGHPEDARDAARVRLSRAESRSSSSAGSPRSSRASHIRSSTTRSSPPIVR